jgi:hypothetical protein
LKLRRRKNATPQYRADDGDVEIDSCRNMGRVQALFVQDIAQQEIVEMTAMARYVDHLLVLRHPVQAIDMCDLDAVVDACPEPAQKSFHDPDRGVGNIRRNLLRIAARIPACLFQRGRIVAGFIGDRFAHTRRPHDLVDERAAVRQVRTDGSRAPSPKMHSQDTRDLAKRHLGIEIAGDNGAQRQRLAESQQGVASEQQGCEELPGSASDVPVLREQQLEN